MLNKLFMRLSLTNAVAAAEVITISDSDSDDGGPNYTRGTVMFAHNGAVGRRFPDGHISWGEPDESHAEHLAAERLALLPRFGADGLVTPGGFHPVHDHYEYTVSGVVDVCGFSLCPDLPTHARLSWTGYPESCDSWERASHIKGSGPLKKAALDLWLARQQFDRARALGIEAALVSSNSTP